jgi:hypothetical protein
MCSNASKMVDHEHDDMAVRRPLARGSKEILKLLKDISSQLRETVVSLSALDKTPFRNACCQSILVLTR